MRTRVQKWGNSLAVRIPRPFALEARLDADSPVDLSIVDGQIVVTPVSEPAVTLEDLLRGVTDENLHGEIDTGPAVSRETW